MTGQEMEKAIEFLLNHAASVDTKIALLVEAQTRTNTQINGLGGRIDALGERIDALAERIEETRQIMDEGFKETRAALNRLMDVCENARDDAINTSKYANDLDKRIARLEKKK